VPSGRLQLLARQLLVPGRISDSIRTGRRPTSRRRLRRQPWPSMSSGPAWRGRWRVTPTRPTGPWVEPVSHGWTATWSAHPGHSW